MTTKSLDRVIDADGHVMEDIPALVSYLPPEYTSARNGRTPFPPLDHLHSANQHSVPEGSFAPIREEGWMEFLDDVGIESTILYTTAGLPVGNIVNKDWAVDLCRAYNDWLHDTYVTRSPRFKGMGLIPLQEPEEAAAELRRIVRDLGMTGAMLPSIGIGQTHLGDSRYWPVYEAASELKCALGVHGSVHQNLGLDEMSPYAPVNALGHPFGQMIAFAGLVFNGVFDKYPDARFGFLEAGSGWLLTCYERFSIAHKSHVQYDPRKRFFDIHDGESVGDYIQRHIDADRIFVGVEGSEVTIPYAIDLVGNKPFLYSSDFPHEVNNETCKEEINEIRENERITHEDKEAILFRNAERFYRL